MCIGVRTDVEHLGEVLSQAVRGRALNATAIGGDVAFDGCGVITASELLVLGLLSPNDRNSQKLFVDLSKS